MKLLRNFTMPAPLFAWLKLMPMSTQVWKEASEFQVSLLCCFSATASKLNMVDSEQKKWWWAGSPKRLDLLSLQLSPPSFPNFRQTVKWIFFSTPTKQENTTKCSTNSLSLTITTVNNKLVSLLQCQGRRKISWNRLNLQLFWRCWKHNCFIWTERLDQKVWKTYCLSIRW